jgi:hypothetical protein
VGIAICLWVTNVAFLFQGKSLLHLQTTGNPKQHDWAGIIRVTIHFWLFQALNLSLWQVRFVWIPDERACTASNVDGVKLTLVVTLITDILLLVTVLVGLLRSRRDGGGRFGLQGLLWRQV